MTAQGTRNSSQRLTAQLADAIASGRWPTGAKLPSTRELARRFGASRPTVHRALEALHAKGLVEPRPRSGWFLLRTAVPDNFKPIDAQPVFDEMADAPTNWVRSIFNRMQDVLDRENFGLLMLAQYQTGPDEVEKFWKRLNKLGDHVAGVLAVQPNALAPLHEQLDQRGIPWVVINRPHLGFTHNFVSADNDRAGRVIGRAIAAMGVQRIVFLGSSDDRWPSSREKLDGLVGGYIEHAGSVPRVFDCLPCNNSPEHHGYNAMRDYLRNHQPPQFIYAHGDYLAIGAMRACMESGLRVPQDVAVVGSTGLDVSRYIEPSLTVTAQPTRAMGEAAAHMLLHMARHGVRRVPGRVLPCPITFRESFTPPPAMRVELERRIVADLEPEKHSPALS